MTHRKLPKTPDVATAPIGDRWQTETVGGLALIVSTLVALWLANSTWAEAVSHFWETPISVAVGEFTLQLSLLHWINDGLMTVFFFVIGLEIKREVLHGELQGWKSALLPLAAAIGGMVVPAGMYLSWHGGTPAARGWGIPMATDIAFVVGILALFGRRVPRAAKVFLLTLAIVDDLGAVLVIAIAYTDNLAPTYLLPAAVGFVLVVACNRWSVRSYLPYIVLGILIWFCFLKAGVHPTVAGVLLGGLTPAQAWVPSQDLLSVVERIAARLRGNPEVDVHEQLRQTTQVAVAARESVAPLHRLEATIGPWVAIAVMPVFALANAGVAIEPQRLTDAVALAICLGLAAGKPIGILGFSYALVRLGGASLPSGVTWLVLCGAACLAGVGFTMSIFIAGLAWSGAELAAGKVGILAGSALSALLGTGILLVATRGDSSAAKA